MAELSKNAWEVFVNLLIDQARWVHRRVESIEHFDRYNVRRKVSLDIEIPLVNEASSPATRVFLLPLATLEKKPLKNLDVAASNGDPVPVLTAEQNSDLIASFLASQARLVLNHAPGPELREIFSEIALLRPKGRAHHDRAAEAIRVFTERLDPRNPGHQKLRRDLDFINLIQTYGSSFELVALVPGHEGQRLIIKYAFDDVVRLDPEALKTWKEILAKDQKPAGPIRTWARKSRWVRLAATIFQRLGLGPTPLHYPLPGVGSARSYHVEVTAPLGLEIHDGLAMAWRDIGNGRDVQAQSRCGPSRRAHLHVWSATQGALGRLRIRMRPTSAGWMRAAALSSTAIAAMLIVGELGGVLDTLFNDSQESARPAAAGLLIALPGVLAVFLVRSGEHVLTSRLLFGVRLLLMASAGLAYLAAGSLLLSTNVPKSLWFVLTVAGTIIAVVILGATIWPPIHTKLQSRRDHSETQGSELQGV